MKGILFGTVEWTDGGSPVDRLGIKDVDGHVHETRVSSRSAIGFGISNPEYRNSMHAFKVTEAGRVTGTDKDLNRAYHILTKAFPATIMEGPECSPHTLVTKLPSGTHARYSVHVLSVEDGQIVDRSALVARLIGRKIVDGGVLMTDGGMDVGAAVVKQLSDTLWGEGGPWFNEMKVR